MKINRIVAIFIGLLIVILIGLMFIASKSISDFLAYYNSQNTTSNLTSPSPQTDQNKQSPITLTSPVSTPTKIGYITGKLCYPSEFIPPGKIVAKNTTGQRLFTQDYLGTESGAPNNYTLEVEPGTYNVRFETKFNGYYTNYNVDDGSGDHKLKTATVKLGESLARIDICDFYYPQNEEPKF